MPRIHIYILAEKDGRIAGSNSENCTENARRQTSVSVRRQLQKAARWVGGGLSEPLNGR